MSSTNSACPAGQCGYINPKARGICLCRARHDAIALAKQVVTIDRLSGGRFLFGVAAGWLVEEMKNHGVEPSTRWSCAKKSWRWSRYRTTTSRSSTVGTSTSTHFGWDPSLSSPPTLPCWSEDKAGSAFGRRLRQFT